MGGGWKLWREIAEFYKNAVTLRGVDRGSVAIR
jgi:hypothetical protein